MLFYSYILCYVQIYYVVFRLSRHQSRVAKSYASVLAAGDPIAKETFEKVFITRMNKLGCFCPNPDVGQFFSLENHQLSCMNSNFILNK